MSIAANETQAPERRISPEEDLITLTEATKHLPKVDGKRTCVCTLWRWCRRGLRGVVLEYVCVGQNIRTTRQALLRFCSELADPDERVDPKWAGCVSHSRRRFPLLCARSRTGHAWESSSAHAHARGFHVWRVSARAREAGKRSSAPCSRRGLVEGLSRLASFCARTAVRAGAGRGEKMQILY